jgi:hypothetical protein
VQQPAADPLQDCDRAGLRQDWTATGLDCSRTGLAMKLHCNVMDRRMFINIIIRALSVEIQT